MNSERRGEGVRERPILKFFFSLLFSFVAPKWFRRLPGENSIAHRCGITTQTFTFGRSDTQNFLRGGDGKSISASSSLRLSEKHPLCCCCSQVSYQSWPEAPPPPPPRLSPVSSKGSSRSTSHPLHTLPSEDVLASTSRRNPVPPLPAH